MKAKIVKKKLSVRDYAHKKNKYDAEIAKLTDEMNTLKDRITAFKERSSICSERIIKLLQAEDKTRVISGLHQYDVSATPGKVIIKDDKLVPPTFKTSKTVITIDKAMIKKSMQDGIIQPTVDTWFGWESGYTLKHKELASE